MLVFKIQKRNQYSPSPCFIINYHSKNYSHMEIIKMSLVEKVNKQLIAKCSIDLIRYNKIPKSKFKIILLFLPPNLL